MTTVTELNSNNDRKIERMLEYSLIKHENSNNQEEKFRCKLLIDEIYAFEMISARKACSNLEKSMGFMYFVENYKNHEKCLNFFASRLIDEILFFKENVENKIHNTYSSFNEYISNKPKGFLIDIISGYDEELSKFIKLNASEINKLDSFIDFVGQNWVGYEIDKRDCNKLISKLDAYYDRYLTRSGFSRVDLYIYLFKKNDMIEDFKKYYIMEDISLEELNDLIEQNDIFKNKFSIKDIKRISEMERIIQENYIKEGKRLKI